jgi:hypothetical protein
MGPPYHLFNLIELCVEFSSGLGLEFMLTPGQSGAEREKETE